jgi:hypothetical protein
MRSRFVVPAEDAGAHLPTLVEDILAGAYADD